MLIPRMHMNVHSSFLGDSSKQCITPMSNRQVKNSMYLKSGQIPINARTDILQHPWMSSKECYSRLWPIASSASEPRAYGVHRHTQSRSGYRGERGLGVEPWRFHWVLSDCG